MFRKATRRSGWLPALILAGAVSACPFPLEAQFHLQDGAGQAQVNQSAVNQAMQQAAAMNQQGGAMNQQGAAGQDYAAGLSGGDMVLAPELRDALASYGVSIEQMRGRPADVWGRMIRHSDESYTESKEDFANDSLEQTTYSKNGVRLQRRIIALDALKRPSEVLIYNGRGDFRYRGMLLYDQFNRFAEEQTYDAQGTLIRRKVQEYAPDGHKRPLRSWDYVANVPEDLKLIVLRESEEAQTRAAPSAVAQERRPFFRGRQQAAEPAPPAPAQIATATPAWQPPAPEPAQPPPAAPTGLEGVPAQVAADGAAQEGRRGFNLGRMFGNRGR